MRIAILGRTKWLLVAASALAAEGHVIALVATADAAPEYGVGPEDFRALAERHASTFLHARKGDEAILADALRTSGAQTGVSINWPWVIGQVVCDAVPNGIFNAHAGDLPRYRGNACPNWAILNGEDRIGLCIHRMEPGAIDAGPIFARTYLPVTNNTYIADVYSWMHEVIPSLFVEAMIRLAEPGFSPIDQHALSARPLRCQPRRPEDGRIDWNCDARQIQRLVRASARPFAGAYAWVNGGRRVTVWRACLAELDHDILAVPGQIMGRGPNGGILVACGAGVIEIEEAEVEGGGALPSANRHRLTSMPDIAARP